MLPVPGIHNDVTDAPCGAVHEEPIDMTDISVGSMYMTSGNNRDAAKMRIALRTSALVGSLGIGADRNSGVTNGVAMALLIGWKPPPQSGRRTLRPGSRRPMSSTSHRMVQPSSSNNKSLTIPSFPSHATDCVHHRALPKKDGRLDRRARAEQGLRRFGGGHPP